MTDVFHDSYTERLLDRTFNACRAVLQSPLEDSSAVNAVSECARLDYEIAEKCMIRLTYDGIILHKNGRFALARKGSLA